MKTFDAQAASPFFRFGQLVLSSRFLRVVAFAYFLSSLLLWFALGALFVRGEGKAASQSIGPDFAAFYTAGTLFREGEKSQLYDFARQGQLQHQLHLTQGAHELSAFVHPAHWAVLMAPLSTLSPRAAYAIYAALMFACFVAGLLLLRSILPILQARSGWLWLALALFSSPVYFSISAGQNTGLTFLLHCAILVALTKKRDLWAGVLCGIGLLKPHLFLILLPLFWFEKRPRALLGFAITAFLTLIFDVAVFGSDVFARNWDSLQTPLYRHEEIVQSARMFSWQSFWRLLLGANAGASLLGWLCAIGVFVALCASWKRFSRSKNTPPTPQKDARQSNDFALLYAITICGMITIVPHLPVYDLGLLLLPVLVFANRVLDFTTRQFVALRLLLLSLIFFAALGEDFAQQTRFQIVVPLLTAILFLAMQLPTASSRSAANT